MTGPANTVPVKMSSKCGAKALGRPEVLLEAVALLLALPRKFQIARRRTNG